MADENKLACQADTLLGLPPLKMVLTESRPIHKNAAIISSPKGKPVIQAKIRQPRSEQEIVLKLIEHLTENA